MYVSPCALPLTNKASLRKKTRSTLARLDKERHDFSIRFHGLISEQNCFTPAFFPVESSSDWPFKCFEGPFLRPFSRLSITPRMISLLRRNVSWHTTMSGAGPFGGLNRPVDYDSIIFRPEESRIISNRRSRFCSEMNVPSSKKGQRKVFVRTSKIVLANAFIFSPFFLSFCIA